MTPDELAEHLKLPPHLAEAPYLQPFYGTVAWSVRSVFSGELGWFDGDSARLNPLTRSEKARLLVRLAGSEEALLTHARQALDNGEYQTALELSGHLIRLDSDNPSARDIRVQSLMALGEREENPNARHYYLTEALEIRDRFVALADARPKPEQVRRFPLEGVFRTPGSEPRPGRERKGRPAGGHKVRGRENSLSHPRAQRGRGDPAV